MVVATIISIMALAFQPAFSKSMADKRTVSAAAEVVRIGRRARSESVGLQRAYLMAVQPGAGVQGTGVVQLLRGNSLHCALEDWSVHAATCTANPVPGSACPENLNLNVAPWYRSPFGIRLRTINIGAGQEVGPGPAAALKGGGGGIVSICYEPSGLTHWSTAALGGAMTFSQLASGAAAGGGFMFAVGLVADGTVVGVPIMLSFPLGGTPRRLR